jgi:hypothetical protein
MPEIPTASIVMAGLCLLSGVFWWQEARKAEDKGLSLRGRIHQRLTFLFAVLAIIQFFAFR